VSQELTLGFGILNVVGADPTCWVEIMQVTVALCLAVQIGFNLELEGSKLGNYCLWTK
jgi:hypothetical protein